MAGMGAGYDLSVSTFSPDGRVFQVEYASKAVDHSGTALSAVCKDGVILGVEKLSQNKMLVPGTGRRIFAIDKHIGVAIAGFIADSRQIVARARSEAAQYRETYDEAIPARVLAERLGLFVHAYTLYWSVRPFGASILVGTFNKADNEDPAIYCIEPSGTCYKYFGMALGKGKQTAKTEMEKLTLKDMTCKDALFHIAKILHQVHEEHKEKTMEIEMGWVCSDSSYVYEAVPKALIEDAEKRALAALEERDDEMVVDPTPA